MQHLWTDSHLILRIHACDVRDEENAKEIQDRVSYVI